MWTKCQDHSYRKCSVTYDKIVILMAMMRSVSVVLMTMIGSIQSNNRRKEGPEEYNLSLRVTEEYNLGLRVNYLKIIAFTFNLSIDQIKLLSKHINEISHEKF